MKDSIMPNHEGPSASETQMREQEVRFKAGELALAGTLAVPDRDGPYPGVLFIAGSGQTDRDENTKKFHLNVFSELSQQLAKSGIASLRYDKRGVGQSEGDHWTTGFYDHAQDALAALQFFKLQETIRPDEVFLLGHSEGALLAAKLAGSGADVAGIVMLAGAAQSGEAVLKWQAVQIAKGLSGLNGWIVGTFHIDVAKSQQKEFDKIKGTQKDWYRRQFIVKMNAKWLREFMAYDPTEDLQGITVPALAITGSKDIQVNPADLERMAGLIRAPFESHVVPDMTHILRVEEGEATLSNYKKELKRPLDHRLVELVLHWIDRQVDRGNETDV